MVTIELSIVKIKKNGQEVAGFRFVSILEGNDGGIRRRMWNSAPSIVELKEKTLDRYSLQWDEIEKALDDHGFWKGSIAVSDVDSKYILQMQPK
jgi:hypothetical protein